MRFRLAILASSVLVLAACGDKKPPLAPPTLTTMELKPAKVSADVGEAVAVSIRGVDQYGAAMTRSDVTLAVDDSMIAVVTGTTGVRAMQPGTTTLRATVGALTAAVSFTVSGNAVARIQVLLPDTLRYGVTVVPSVTLLDTAGHALFGRRVTWTITSAVPATYGPDVARIVIPIMDLTPRPLTLTVSSEGVTATRTTTVAPAPVGNVTVTTGKKAVWSDSVPVALTVWARDSLGAPIESLSVRVAVGDPSIVALSGQYPDTMRLTGMKNGNTTITTTVRGKVVTQSMSVYSPVPFGIKLVIVGDVPPKALAAAQWAAKRWAQMLWHTVNTARAFPASFGCVPTDMVVTDSIVIAVKVDSMNASYAAVGGSCLTDYAGPNFVSRGGHITFSRDWVARTTDTLSLRYVATHEIGHVLGSGTISNYPALGYGKNVMVRDTINGPPFFVGPNALAAWAKLGGTGWRNLPGVPLAPYSVYAASAFAHWETTFSSGETMNPGSGPATSILTLGQLKDIGYSIRPEYADAWTPRLTSLRALFAPIDDRAELVRVVTPAGVRYEIRENFPSHP